MDKKEMLKQRIKQVKNEIKKEPSPKKKQRLNTYKNKLEVELRNYTFFMNGGKIIKEQQL